MTTVKIPPVLRPQTGVLVHGEAGAKAWMKDNLEYYYEGLRVLLPAEGEEIEV